MKNTLRKAALPVVLSLAMFAGAAFAQEASTAPAPASSATHAAGKTHAQRRADAVEQRIEDMHTQLKITDAQSAQWNAYAQTMRDNATRAAAAFHDRAQNLAGMNADDVMKSYAQLAQMHADDMQKLSTAWSALYAVLLPDQKQIANDMFHNRASHPHPMPRNRATGAAPASASSSATKPGGT
ncbi:MAG TPA: Spy/CpxP family protein refolding chaperone [Dyella sp.]|uniref:Spy/CpxP family protein refolding chaperone n=1 Tax=Dyella sp. TaxID=1869338 RepID=UPI002BDC9C59|nr:Spy/CpxP family protein refolding chaperone [Dyella sp.]HTV86805.1 Spy/CpxP family protein refolding chaperone [Dyella sp.]